ncbi:CD209 antigen-like protein E isoform X1 [Rhinichthys klamathensis goyatoka]|uniref:CD209 antigen-like protein E isoform X1 n=1 Tax=Rhinichthys klamathensis goyatoka TaxID=3034132 RepID=UPI0024B557CE|nr:CD209 antigen-like protein E isoform X1 [Rhinichthys klamathensis goyatoka]
MHRKDGQTTDYIYENDDDVIKGNLGKEITDSTQDKSSECTGSDSVRNRSSRAAAVCLVLLCVLLLTAVIVLCVHIHTKSTNYTEERDQLLTNNTRLTEERDQLLTNITRLTEERYRLISKNENLTNERDQLRNNLQSSDGWTYYKSSFYYMPNETKSWNESRRYCTERGADLIIINNREEQDFVKNMTGKAIVWIGLTDSDVDGRWKWVDGSTLTSGFWANGEPNGRTKENCVLTVAVPKLPEWPKLVGWLDDACTKPFQWICEKSISQLILP